jgi:hypothetical protein
MFLTSSQIVGFQMVSVNGASSNEGEFAELSKTMFDQFKKTKPKPTRKVNWNLEADQRQIEAYSDNNNFEKIGFNIKAPASDAYSSIHKDPTKSISVIAFMNALAADSFTQLEFPLSTISTFKEKITTLQYVVVELDGDKNDQDNFHRCNCYFIADHQRYNSGSWSCGSSLQPEANRKNVLNW